MASDKMDPGQIETEKILKQLENRIRKEYKQATEEMQDKIDALREKNAQQAVVLNNTQQTAQFQAMLAPIAEDLASIKCKLPKTEVIPATPEYVAINRSINLPYCGGFGFGNGFGFPFGFNNAF